MRMKVLGKGGLKVSEMGLGCMGMSELYGPYTNEELLGRAIRDRRSRVVVATKFGIVRGSDPIKRGINGRPEYVQASCEGSLKRLGVETIDLYYQHRVDPEDEVLATCRELRVGFVAYSPLGRGFLGGSIKRFEDPAQDDWRRTSRPSM